VRLSTNPLGFVSVASESEVKSASFDLRNLRFVASRFSSSDVTTSIREEWRFFMPFPAAFNFDVESLL